MRIAEVTNDLMYELLKKIQSDVATLKDGQRDTRQDILNLRNYMHAMYGDINGLHADLAHIGQRLDRIEDRLELRELSEAKTKFDHNK